MGQPGTTQVGDGAAPSGSVAQRLSLRNGDTKSIIDKQEAALPRRGNPSIKFLEKIQVRSVDRADHLRQIFVQAVEREDKRAPAYGIRNSL